MRNFLLLSFVGGFMFAALVANAQSPLSPGKNFKDMGTASTPPNASATAGTGSKEIVEFFMYRCPHCRTSREETDMWRKNLPKGTTFRRVPLVFNPLDLAHASMYYTLESLGKLDELEARVFQAVQTDRKLLSTPEEQAAFFQDAGVAPDAYMKAFNALSVKAKVSRASREAQGLAIDTAPSLVVAGRYVTNPALAGSASEAMRVAGAVLDRVIAGDTRALAGSAVATSKQQQAAAGTASPSDKSSKSAASPGISLQRLAGGAGMWPDGVEPGNLYIVKYRLTTDAFDAENVMLISARSKSEAEQSYERAWNTMRDEALKPLYDQSKLAGQNGAAGRANLAVHSPRYKLDYRVTKECVGANWGAVVSISVDRSFHVGAACGARTPAEAITDAFEACATTGYNCNREGSRNPTPIITLAHSGAKPWVEPVDKPRLGSSWPPATFQFTSLSATTYQMHASTLDYVQGPNEAIASFGKACGKKAHARDIYACWISSRSMPCILNAPINPQDKMPMQQACIDVRLTKDGYLP